ncbi:pathogenesis-related protein 5-like [Durio zibethinus]|uniref:Pathogenesis-related protein 5-like n=1 Tax=Durio zibethinus TaxID=66656 RepID=A0A6P5Z8U0_DURZI|nr:pathogenesis-related protein 5-like [Durio zibethinus]
MEEISNRERRRNNKTVMDLHSISSLALVLNLIVLIATSKGVSGASFKFVNRCDYTVWPGILANAGSPTLDSTGFELPKDSSRSFQAPTGWSGRFWGRTGCTFDGSSSGTCLTGDCGSGQMECNGLGGAPPVTLAEFTLGTGGQDFYDVSLVDGYNIPMIIEGSGGSGLCASTGCTTDLNQQCPSELRVGDGDACKSACEVFASPEYCCSGAYSTPSTCKPSVYSEMFKAACPRSYSYAYDDATSTFTCTGADYTITFCPSSPSQKSSRDAIPVAEATPTTGSTSQGSGSESELTYSGNGYGYSGPAYSSSGYGYYGTEYSGSGFNSEVGSGQTGWTDGSWLAGLAMGDSPRTAYPYILQSVLMALTAASLLFSFLYL